MSGMVLRSQKHPEQLKYFTEGVGSVFRQWTALELAVFHQWGGPTSVERARVLVEEVLDLFRGPDRVYKDDIAIILEDYMDTQFSTVCEDGSCDELGELLVDMWRRCGEGDFTLVTNALAREYVRHETLARSQGLEAGDAIDSDEEEGAENTMETIDEEVIAEVAAPMIDEDGFETVTKRGRKKPSQR